MRALVFDIETSFIKAYTFGIRNVDIPYQNIIEDWYVLCGAWKELGKSKVYSVAIPDFKTKNHKDDYNVVKTMREAFDGADLLIGHNIDSFDIRKFNSRLIYHRLPPLPLIPTIDTYRELRRVAEFTSHRLDYINKVLNGHGKLSNPPDLWHRCMDGDKAAFDHMVKYNKIDVQRTEELYEVIRPYLRTSVHIGALMGKPGKDSCKNCGSIELKKNGLRYTATGMVRQEYQCKTCGSYTKVPVAKTK
jgi:DNA polymerase III epsilon subunit-like protein